MKIAHFQKHFGEEPCISGINPNSGGSGTIFFAGCNLHCVYCQNHQISQKQSPDDLFSRFKDYSTEELSQIMLELQNQGALNINLVSPSHMGTQIIDALKLAKAKGLGLPIVYNSNGYDAVGALKLYEGLIDIYLPDLKYGGDENAVKYSNAPRYSEISQAAIREMFRQVGNLTFLRNPSAEEPHTPAKGGLIIRHLVLPNRLAESFKALDFVAALSKDIFVSIMAQYYPAYRAADFSELNRPLLKEEYQEVLDYAQKIGLKNILGQALESKDHYRPDFDSKHPF